MTKKKSEPNRPTHDIFVVHGEDEKAKWIKIGKAWMHKDGRGANLLLEALPNGGRTVMREIKEKDEGDIGGQQ